MEILNEKPQLSDKARARPLRLKDLELISKGQAEAIKQYVKEAVDPLLKRVAELEAQQMSYRGVWKAGVPYGENCLVTDHGSLWFAKRATLHRPGKSDDWRLMSKRGHRG